MANYRDYGTINGGASPLVPINTIRYGQVYQATHDEQSRLPFMKRSFISFTFGEKRDANGIMKPVHIEDFNLIAYTDGDRLQRNAYGEFGDLTSEYDVIQGQFYWGTWYHTNSLSLDLATDGMTQRDLDDFKYWFRAGSVRELILAEHPNRAIMARVSSPPQLELLPFETEVEMPFQVGTAEDAFWGDKIYKTSTTLYRGEIRLEFVMDEPFWYAKQNILGIQNVTEGYYEDSWIDANGVKVSVKDSPDALKIIYEDHIPLGSSTTVSAFLGGDIYASVKYQDYSRIVTQLFPNDEEQARIAYEEGIEAAGADLLQRSAFSYETIEQQVPDPENPSQTITEEITKYYKGGVIARDEGVDGYIGAIIAGASMDSQDESSGVEIPQNSLAYLYYAGNAPSPVKLTFTLTPTFNVDSSGENNFGSYIISPKNKYTDTETPYNVISLTASARHEFRFTLPTFWSNYNQALQIFDNPNIIRGNNAWLMVRETIRDTIRHPVIRAWANRVIDIYNTMDASTGIITAGGEVTNSEDREAYYASLRSNLKQAMSLLFKTNSGTPFSAIFEFNGKTGEATGRFTYRDPAKFVIADDVVISKDNLSEGINVIKNMTPENYTITKEENVGDMVKSSYLILDERNILNNKFQVQEWSELHPDYAYKIEHDISNGLENVRFEFKNMYL